MRILAQYEDMYNLIQINDMNTKSYTIRTIALAVLFMVDFNIDPDLLNVVRIGALTWFILESLYDMRKWMFRHKVK